MKNIFISTFLILVSAISVFASGHTVSITSSTNVSCFGSCNGTATATATGGIGPYTYAWAGPSGYTATGPTATNLCAGTYTVSATDNSDMSTAVVNVTITQPTQLIAVINSGFTTCFGSCDGQLYAYVTGGVPPYNFLWNNTITNQQVTGLCAGTYTVTITDIHGCSTTAIGIINQPSQLVVNIISSGLSCGNCNGSASVLASGGTTPYTYLWNVFSGGNPWTMTQNNLCIGTYAVTVTDANGCNATSGVTINNSTGLTLVASSTPATCNNYDGTACINSVIGGVPPFAYIWSNGVASSCCTTLNSGTINVTVQDSFGCSNDTSFYILNSNGVNIVLDSIVNLNCNNNNSGSITIHGTGGSVPYHYIWSNGDTTATASNLAPGSYYVQVYDSDSCSTYTSFIVLNTYNLYAAVTTTNANCYSNGTASAIYVSGAHPPFSYLWDDPSNQTIPTATNLTTGTYHCTITDSIGCYIIASAQVGSFNYNIIKGRVYLDINQNCVQDIGEPGIPNVSIYSNNSYYASTNTSGDYLMHTNQMSNTISPYSNLSGYSPTCPSPSVLNVNFTNACDTSLSNDFGYYADPNAVDLVIHPGWSNANPGFDKHYWICYYNNSPTSQNALIRFTYDPSLQYLSCTQGGIHYPADHKIEWTFINLPHANLWDWNTKPEIYFHVPASVSIYDTLCSYFEILPVINDTYPFDNTLNTCESVTGCHDPNSKDVLPRGQTPQGYITTSDSVLLYNLHFQNDGNDTCLTVVIIDTLSQYLNPATIVPGASSHPYTFTLTDHGTLTFRFDQILLPDSNANEPASNGYVNYTVHLKPNLPIGTEINNTAHIFFDFNTPIATNTTRNTIASPLQISEPEINAKVNVFPNPFSDYTTFEINNGKADAEYSIEIFDLPGKCVQSYKNIHTNSFNISAKNLESGIYLYKVMDSEKEIGKGKIIVE